MPGCKSYQEIEMSEESGVVFYECDDTDDQGRMGEQPAGEDLELQMPEASAPTILDRLHDDCWRMVLDFVPTRDIFRSERVSKRWQRIVQHYLRGLARRIEIQGFGTGDLSQEVVQFVEKLERVAIMDYTSTDNLDDTMDMADEEFRNSVLAYRDGKVSTFFWRNFRPTNLKTLTIRGGFDFRYFLSAVECYPKLTELILQGELKNPHLLFEKMPKLERLCLMDGYREDISVRIENIRGLGCLKQFLIWQTCIQYCWPELVLTGCKGLEILDVRSAEISSYLEDLCKAHGPTLTEIRIIDNYVLLDDDLVTIITSCPKLKSLDLRACDQLSDAFLPKVASAVRGRPGALRLHLGGFKEDKYNKIKQSQTQYPELIMEVEPPPEHSFFYCDVLLRPRHYIWGIEDYRNRDRLAKFV